MSKPCPGCGATTVPEARFCRLCGAPLKPGSVREDKTPVSPHAQTVPLKGEGRATGGLAADDSRRGAPETSKVARAEIEEILQRVESDYHSNGEERNEQDKAETSAQQTAALKSEQTAAPPPQDAALATASDARQVQPSTATRSRRLWTFAALALLCVALIAGVLAFVLSRRASSTDSGGAQPISISDQKQLLNEKLAEAETLLESGEFNHAIEVLRAAVKIDSTSVEAHMRLGNALERTGARNEAIEEYRLATQIDSNNSSVLHALASAQFEEKLYNDAAESYRRMLAANASSFDDETWLAYGDALRLAGRKEEARAAYQKINASGTAAIAEAAHQRLAELGPAPVTANTEHPRTTTAGQQQERTAEVVTPSPTPTPLARSTATITAPAVANGTNKADYDAYYFQALNVVNGRDPKKIERAELLHALALFQRAALGGTHQAEAQRYADRFGKEYDRRRKL